MHFADQLHPRTLGGFGGRLSILRRVLAGLDGSSEPSAAYTAAQLGQFDSSHVATMLRRNPQLDYAWLWIATQRDRAASE